MLVLAVESVISTAVVGSLVACVGHVRHVVIGHVAFGHVGHVVLRHVAVGYVIIWHVGHVGGGGVAIFVGSPVV